MCSSAFPACVYMCSLCRALWRYCIQTVICLRKTSTSMVTAGDTSGWPAPASSSWSAVCVYQHHFHNYVITRIAQPANLCLFIYLFIYQVYSLIVILPKTKVRERISLPCKLQLKEISSTYLLNFNCSVSEFNSASSVRRSRFFFKLQS